MKKPTEADLKLCTCGPICTGDNPETLEDRLNPELHKDTCPFRLKFDSIQITVPFTEEELLGLLFFLSRISSTEHEMFLTNHGPDLHAKVFTAVKILAEMKNTGKVPGESHASDCAVHNMPDHPNGPCDCGSSKL